MAPATGTGEPPCPRPARYRSLLDPQPDHTPLQRRGAATSLLTPSQPPAISPSARSRSSTVREIWRRSRDGSPTMSNATSNAASSSRLAGALCDDGRPPVPCSASGPCAPVALPRGSPRSRSWCISAPESERSQCAWSAVATTAGVQPPFTFSESRRRRGSQVAPRFGAARAIAVGRSGVRPRRRRAAWAARSHAIGPPPIQGDGPIASTDAVGQRLAARRAARFVAIAS